MFSRVPRYPLLWAIIGWHVVWGIVALGTDAAPLIEFLNGLVLAVSLGVVVAYFRPMWAGAWSERPDEGQILITGIWLQAVSVIEMRAFSVVWRWLGSPMRIANTDFTTHFIALSLLALLLHLAGPEAIHGRVPTREWVRIGMIVALGLALAVCLVFFGLAMRSG